jgi:RHO protein GDP dissociation inhibitor
MISKLVDKDEDKMGSFAPQEKEHVFDLPWCEAPSGFLARGDYKGKGLVKYFPNIVFGQRRHSALPIRLRNDHRQLMVTMILHIILISKLYMIAA